MIINRFIVVQTTYESTQRVMLSLSIDNPYRRVPKGVIKIARSTLSKWVSCVKGSYRRDSSTVRYAWRPRRVCRSFWISVKVTIGIINQLPSRYRSSRSRLNHSWTESIGDQGRNISLAKKKTLRILLKSTYFARCKAKLASTLDFQEPLLRVYRDEWWLIVNKRRGEGGGLWRANFLHGV